MTTALSLDGRSQNRSEQVEQLRRQMAAVSGKVGHSRRADVGADGPAPDSESLLPVPKLLSDLLPRGLPRGVVAVLTGARSLPLNMVAAVTAAGGYAAIIGDPRASLLAAVEMGADLGRLAMIPEPGADPLEVATVLMDGMDLVVLDLTGCSVAPTRARSIAARARHKGCTLLVTGADWQGAQVRLDARVRGYELTGGCGSGRVGEVRLSLRARGRCARAG